MKKKLSKQFDETTWGGNDLEEYWQLRMLLDGIYANIVVYDSDETKGNFTKRLVSLMKTIALRNNVGALEKIYTPALEFEEGFIGGPTKCYGVELIKSKDYTGYYVALGGSLIHYKATVIIGECENGALLGMY